MIASFDLENLHVVIWLHLLSVSLVMKRRRVSLQGKGENPGNKVLLGHLPSSKPSL